MRYSVEHLTKVEYSAPVRSARFNLRLHPVAWPGQVVTDFKLTIDPEPYQREERAGAYPFALSRIEIDLPIEDLAIHSSFTAEVADAMLELDAPDLTIGAVAQAALLQDDLGPWSPVHYIYPSLILPGSQAIATWARGRLEAGAPAFASGLALAREIHARFTYDPEATEADTPVAEAFALRRGVCQDFAHVLISAFRSAGLPAAYVSGYLRTTPPPGQKRLVGVDAMHAWAALWCGPQRGWVGLDPTNGCVAASGHLVVAMGRDYADVSPIDGIFVGGGAQQIATSVDVMPLDE